MTKLEVAVRLTEAYLRSDADRRRFGDSQPDSIILSSPQRRQFAEAVSDLAEQLIKNCGAGTSRSSV